MSSSEEQLFAAIDVESIGLHGEGFAVGFVLFNSNQHRLEEGLFSCPPETAQGESANREWVWKHVPALPITHEVPFQVRSAFWAKWLEWKELGAILLTDCGWPVEARFLSQCIDDDPHVREWEGPYPLLDLSSILLSAGECPLAQRERKEDELPVHDPLADARQSARIFCETLPKVRRPRPPTFRQ